MLKNELISAGVEMDIIEFLAEYGVLLVHFSGAEGAEPYHKQYPRNLQAACRQRFDLCCSTIGPDEKQFAWGYIGLIVKPDGIGSIKGCDPSDFGSSRQEDLFIEVQPKYQMVNRETLQDSITKRGDMNEWVVSGYSIVGIYIADLVACSPLVWGSVTSELAANFPGLPVYTSFLDRFVKYTGPISTEAVAVRDIYAFEVI